MLGSIRIGANRASAPGRRLYAWITCFVPPALGLSEGGGRCVTLGSIRIGANRASAPGRRLYAWIACFVPPALGLSEVRKLWYDKLGSTYIGANRASASGRCGSPRPTALYYLRDVVWSGTLGLEVTWFKAVWLTATLGPCFLTCCN